MFIPSHYKRLKRGPQVILPKDIGVIIVYANINKNSICIDAGTGSGWLAVSMAKICKEVYSYELKPEFVKIAEHNKRIENLDNLIIHNADITKKIFEKDVDVVVLDLPNSEKAVKNAYKALKDNGYVAGYVLHIEQLRKFFSKLEKYGFKNIFAAEVIMRDILIREAGIRPSTKGIWHTGYLIFGQKHIATGKPVQPNPQKNNDLP